MHHPEVTSKLSQYLAMNIDFEATKVLQKSVTDLTELSKKFKSEAQAASSAASNAQNRYYNTIKPALADFKKRIESLEKKKLLKGQTCVNEVASLSSFSFKRSPSVSLTLAQPLKRSKVDHDNLVASSVDLNSTILRARHVEHGLLHHLSSFPVVLRFETFPIWVLSLDPQFITCICLPDYPSWTSFQCAFSHSFNNKILLEALRQLTPSKFHFGGLPSIANSYLHLYSGSSHFLHTLYEPSSNTPCIYLVHAHTHVRIIPLSPLIFSRINHKSVGGVTTFTSLWSSENLHFTPILTGLRPL